MDRIVVTPEFIDIEASPVARALLAHIIDHADIVSHDHAGRPVMRFEFSCEPWLLDKLAAFGASREDLEAEPLEDSL